MFRCNCKSRYWDGRTNRGLMEVGMKVMESSLSVELPSFHPSLIQI